MSYLSRIPLAPLREGSRKLLGNPEAMHAAVLGAVAYHPDPGRTLWRVDTDNPHRPHLWAVTQTEPDWTALVEQAGWAVDNQHAKPVVAPYKPLLAQLDTGQTYGFRLSASPVQNTDTPDKLTAPQAARRTADEAAGRRTRPHRLGHRTARHQLDWLTERVNKYGFELCEVPASADPAPGILPLFDNPDLTPAPVLDVTVTGRDRRVFNKTEPNGTRNQVTITMATYAGTLRVTDPVALARALITGIGPGKAYGCGLLTLAQPGTK
ncbi:type I-E CRISPR-associated protein Cas6/Cse3/CasE [Streptomyces sp. NPDC051364]|uniref:type I-E CRISPR-associated protein Cas6/Cse3/CasE n=1 Tax=Streptomyces sp. NPDC051364 TaxID=3155799 RepID=UPI003424F1BE